MPRLSRLVALAVAFLAIPACAPPAQSPDTSVEEDLMRAYFDVWRSKDLDQLDLLYTEDAIFEDVADGLERRGHAEIRNDMADDIAAVPDVKVEIVSLFASENHGVVEWIWSGTQTEDYPGLIPATGRSFSVRGASLFEFEDGRIKKHLMYYDAARLLHQLGVEFLFPEG